jgi:uncharacterized protein
MEPVDVGVVHFDSTDGTRLEGDLLAPADAIGTAVVCHPHPLYGGSRRDIVVAALTRALVGARRRVLRFDFRGAGGSHGEHAGGEAERDDLRAAIEIVDPREGPLTLVGYSFGADIALSVSHPAADRWIVVAPPLSILAPTRLIAATDPRPVDILVGVRDQFNPPTRLHGAIAEWADTTVHTIEEADHFFAGTHTELTARVARLLRMTGGASIPVAGP